AMVAIVKDYTETSSFWGSSYSRERQGSGSGIIVAQSDTELVLVTNHHVVDGANKLTVTFIDGSTAEAQIKGSDADMDLAVIAIPIDRLDEETRNAIAVAQIGDSESLRLGEQVVAIGNALGYGQSVSGGWISALNREVSFTDGSTGSFIQTDAAINPGNSGGALVNMNGEVIGINSSKIGGEDIDGIGFAIPISAARPIIENLMTKETRFKVAEGETGYMGVTMQAMSRTCISGHS
ncbi:MAG: trypsin-like peptidase domain-containing protein, partial [Acetatifactor sp.]|nr:trypsin-like peptidase domain-containing protein [Acetatifactor sp.]